MIETLPADRARDWLPRAPLDELLELAEAQTLAGFGTAVAYSRKVFIPLTHLCRDVCHYCVFAKAPRHLSRPFLDREQVLSIARAGAARGCKEALFTLGDKPELRYRVARAALDAAGMASTIDYLAQMADLVLAETGLLPHLNPGVLTADELQRLRPVAASMGLMLESSSERLTRRGGPHFGSPDKQPAARLATLRAAGAAGVAMTTGLLVGIGETREERIESLLVLRDVHREHGHVQELIIQNFKPKPGTKMAAWPEAPLQEQLWTIAAARLIFGPGMSIQAPPNLQPQQLADLIRAGVNDWGGVSPVTPDHVNPEAPWPEIERLAEATRLGGRHLVERLALVPSFAQSPQRWTTAPIATRILRLTDARGIVRGDAWFAGSDAVRPPSLLSHPRRAPVRTATAVEPLLSRAAAGQELHEQHIERLLTADGGELQAIVHAADELRRAVNGESVTYVVNRNINYTNICKYHCGFCAFSKGRSAAALRGPGYNLDLEEIARRTVEAAAAGATEVCLQGGIHPSFTGNTYLEIVRAVKHAVPDMHVHAFSPLEIRHGAATLGLDVENFLGRLRDAGLSTLPGTAAEILDDGIRAQICPDKLDTAQWLETISSAHRVGLKTTSTIMYGHLESPVHWARHLLALRRAQQQTRGITEFVPLAYVHMEAPLWRRGLTRSGPTFREVLLMHAVGRLVLHPLIPNIQASWVKLGEAGVAACLDAGCNDMGGTLMDESITRSAGGSHGQQFDAERMRALARSVGRPAKQRNTLYQAAGPLVSVAHAATDRDLAIA